MNILDKHIVSTVIIEAKDLQYDDVIKISFKNAVTSIAKVIIENKEQLPKENVLFVLSCAIYKLKEYMERK